MLRLEWVDIPWSWCVLLQVAVTASFLSPCEILPCAPAVLHLLWDVPTLRLQVQLLLPDYIYSYPGRLQREGFSRDPLAVCSILLWWKHHLRIYFATKNQITKQSKSSTQHLDEWPWTKGITILPIAQALVSQWVLTCMLLDLDLSELLSLTLLSSWILASDILNAV